MKLYAVFINWGNGPELDEDRIFTEEKLALQSLSTLDAYDRKHAKVRSLQVKGD